MVSMARAVAALSAASFVHWATAASSAGQGDDLTLRIIPNATAAKFGAACLDGTPPGYYYRLGDPTRWKVHMRGGGWCFSASDCAARAKSDLGSANYFLSNFSQTPNVAEGLMGMNPANEFYNWSFVFVQYCDGSSWTGANDAPVVAPDGTVLHFRGAYNTAAVVADLEATFGMVSKAQQFVLSGTSAGGLATILTAQRWQALLRPQTQFAAIADSGFFLDFPQYATGVPAYAQSFQAAVGPALWNATRGTLPACVADKAPTGDTWQCFLAEHAFEYTPPATRLLLVESQVDAWSVGNILVLPCTPTTPGSCNSSQLAALYAYANATVARVRAALAAKAARAAAAGAVSTDGVYMTSCYQHGATCADPDWLVQRIAGSDLNTVASGWYFSPPAQQTIVQDGPFPGDPTCQYQATHGWC